MQKKKYREHPSHFKEDSSNNYPGSIGLGTNSSNLKNLKASDLKNVIINNISFQANNISDGNSSNLKVGTLPIKIPSFNLKINESSNIISVSSNKNENANGNKSETKSDLKSLNISTVNSGASDLSSAKSVSNSTNASFVKNINNKIQLAINGNHPSNNSNNNKIGGITSSNNVNNNNHNTNDVLNQNVAANSNGGFSEQMLILAQLANNSILMQNMNSLNSSVYNKNNNMNPSNYNGISNNNYNTGNTLEPQQNQTPNPLLSNIGNINNMNLIKEGLSQISSKNPLIFNSNNNNNLFNKPQHFQNKSRNFNNNINSPTIQKGNFPHQQSSNNSNKPSNSLSSIFPHLLNKHYIDFKLSSLAHIKILNSKYRNSIIPVVPELFSKLNYYK